MRISILTSPRRRSPGRRPSETSCAISSRERSARKGTPEVRFSQQGKPVGKFSLAVNESWKNTQGTRQERVEWFRIVCFGRLAEVCGQYLEKGRHVYIEGRLQTRKWKDRGGAKRTTLEVVASQMRILDRAPKNGNGAAAAGPPKAAGPADESDNPFNEPGGNNPDQDIPF